MLMDILQALILGIVQGLTEFIPISSSGHLVLLHNVLGAQPNDLAFDVALHVGTLLALIIYFWSDLIQYAKALVVKSDQTRIAWLLAGATIPAVIVGVLLESAAESAFRSTKIVALNLIVFGVIMLLAERYYEKQESHTKLGRITTKQGLLVGVAQSLAIVPGVSRSGSTITAGMLLGLERVAATRFAFLLGVPIIAGAAAKVLTEQETVRQISSNADIFIVGMLAAFLSGMFAIKFMLKFLRTNGLQAFAYYRIAFGLIVLFAASQSWL